MDGITFEQTPGKSLGRCADGSMIQQRGLGGGSKVGQGEVCGSRLPGRASKVTVMIPNFITNEMGNHWTLLRKVLTYILKGEKILQRGKV